MNIIQAEYINIDNHPFLCLNIDGKEALIGEFKKRILDMGYVPLHSRVPGVDWSQILPPIYLPPTEKFGGIDLQGCTSDPRILKMAHDFWKAINHLDGQNFKVGPISIPA